MGTRLGGDGHTQWLSNYDDKKWIGQKKGFLDKSAINNLTHHLIVIWC